MNNIWTVKSCLISEHQVHIFIFLQRETIASLRIFHEAESIVAENCFMSSLFQRSRMLYFWSSRANHAKPCRPNSPTGPKISKWVEILILALEYSKKNFWLTYFLNMLHTFSTLSILSCLLAHFLNFLFILSTFNTLSQLLLGFYILFPLLAHFLHIQHSLSTFNTLFQLLAHLHILSQYVHTFLNL